MGIGDQSVFFALGKGSLPMLKSIIDKAGPSTRRIIRSSLTSLWLRSCSSSTRRTRIPRSRWQRQLLAGSPGKDHIRITAAVITNGVNYRIQAEEGVLKAIGTAAKITEGERPKHR